MKTIEIEIRGTSPLLIHRFTEAAESDKKVRSVEVDNRNPRDEATKAAYIAPDGSFFFNGFAIPCAMANAGSNHKMRGSRKSLRFIVPSAVRMESDTVTILNGAGPAKDFEVDSRPVTIPATKGRIMRHRPRFDCWGAKFTLKINDSLIAVKDCQKLLEEAGDYIGIGDFRPQKAGPFGCFRVIEFRELEEKKLP